MTFAQHMQAARRLEILRLLSADDDWQASAEVLCGLLPLRGMGCSLDAVKSEIAWLAEQGLVASEGADGWLLVTVTRRGVDVAQGLARVPGVRRPMPGE